MHLYLEVLRGYPGRCRTLSAADFMSGKSGTLDSAAKNFSLDLSADDIRHIVTDHVFFKHANDTSNSGFADKPHLQEIDELSKRFDDEIAAAV